MPCFNEQEVLPITAPMFLQKMNELIDEGKVSEKSTVCFVDDGSKDDTWEIIQNLAATQKCCEGLSLSRNRGHQNALLAGLMEARLHADAVISMDCDGQDDISAIDEMLDKHGAGAEIVYGVRSSRDSDTAFKRMSAEAFYKLLDKMDVETVFNHADYRLMGSAALDALSEYKEVNLFLRGIVPQLGFKSDTVEYDRTARQAGDTHYPFKKMCALAINGITSLSIKPIRIGVGHRLFAHRLCRHNLGPGVAHHRVECHGLGESRVHDQPAWRRPASSAWRNRGIHRQDLPRGQGAPALHHRKAHVGVSR